MQLQTKNGLPLLPLLRRLGDAMLAQSVKEDGAELEICGEVCLARSVVGARNEKSGVRQEVLAGDTGTRRTTLVERLADLLASLAPLREGGGHVRRVNNIEFVALDEFGASRTRRVRLRQWI